MKKIKFNDCICHSNIPNHNDIKDELLSLISQGNSDTMDDPSSNDRISKLDFGNSKDRTRPWVNKFLPNWDDSLRECVQSMGYIGVDLYNCWFQQYKEHGTHGWHTHGHTFTGAYYLDLPKDSPCTQIIVPANQNQLITLVVKEGDISIFPSYTIHRSPINKTKYTKTIISFNLEIGKPTKEILNQIDRLSNE